MEHSLKLEKIKKLDSQITKTKSILIKRNAKKKKDNRRKKEIKPKFS
jgi:hypothetical protein